LGPLLAPPFRAVESVEEFIRNRRRKIAAPPADVQSFVLEILRTEARRGFFAAERTTDDDKHPFARPAFR
jgi:hypothetical protein